MLQDVQNRIQTTIVIILMQWMQKFLILFQLKPRIGENDLSKYAQVFNIWTL